MREREKEREREREREKECVCAHAYFLQHWPLCHGYPTSCHGLQPTELLVDGTSLIFKANFPLANVELKQYDKIN